MCGIYGTTLRYEPAIIKRKLNLMHFRGPDYMGYASIPTPDGDEMTLGHVRLSIIDLDARSNQPFKYNDNIFIVFNGEIYNYKELKKQYLTDVIFRTESDTEVICAMYEKYGEKSVKYLNGMFAFVIYDKNKNILFGARDRLGKKPFYYWYSDKGFEFASQPKVIQYGNEFQIDRVSRQLYLMHGWVPDPYCIYKRMRKLCAGHSFKYSLDTGELQVFQYWDLFTNSCGFKIPQSYEEAKEQVKELLFDAVKIRLNADVPVGTFISGGIDSSLISAIVSHFNKDLYSYTAHFDNLSLDESELAKTTANYLKIPIRVCDCRGEDLRKVFGDYLDYFDEPFADDSLIPTSIVAQKAREDVTVILGGDGGDELFYGYPKYDWVRVRIEQYNKPYWLRKLASPYYYCKGGLQELIESTQCNYSNVYRSLGMFCYSMEGTEKFNRIKLAKQLPYNSVFENRDRGVLVYSDYDIKTFMNGVNMKVDRATMRCSLELRSPIQDYRLAEYSRLLPYDYLYDKRLGFKRILKDILCEFVPSEITQRPKMGFMPPTADWFRDVYKEEFLDTISYTYIRDMLPEINTKKCIKYRDLFLDKKMNNSRMFFSLFTYIRWYQKYVNAGQ